jgi:hypothetical protein
MRPSGTTRGDRVNRNAHPPQENRSERTPAPRRRRGDIRELGHPTLD